MKGCGRGLGLFALLSLFNIPMLAATAAAAPNTPPPPAKDRSRATAAAVPTDVRDALRRGPTEVVVSFDSVTGLNQIGDTTRLSFDGASRKLASDRAAAAFAAVKNTARRQAGDGVHIVRDYDHLALQSIVVDSDRAATSLASAPGVVSLALPQRLTTVAQPADLIQINQPQAAAAGYTGAGVAVAVLDTGVDYTLAGATTAFGDCTGGPGTGTCRIDRLVDVANTGQRDSDPGHHGTNVTGIVAETAPDAHLDVYDVFGTDAGGHYGAADGDIFAALNAVVRDGPALNIRAVNMSLGVSGTYNPTECGSSPYSTAFLNLRGLGIVPVVAAGNDAYDAGGTFHDGVSSPACASGAVRVGAVYDGSFGSQSWGDPLECTDPATALDQIVCFSQSGPLLSVLAPGAVITAAGVTESGTSQATPHVAGAVADLVTANPAASAQQVTRALTTTGPAITDIRNDKVTNRLDILAATTAVREPAAVVGDTGCSTSTLPANDDGSTGNLALPFAGNFFGTTYSSLYVNNNGNVTFRAPLSTYTPFTIDASTPPIIAPFFADVDTRGGGSPVTYGSTTVGSRAAFCVNWRSVGYFGSHADKLNSFQLLLVDRGDIGAGDFDIMMNFDTLVWETGDASGGTIGFGGTPAGAGFSAGDGNVEHFFQFPGSLSHLGLLDNNPTTGLVNSSRGSLVPGRYVFPVRNGAPPGSATITGLVRDEGGAGQAAAPVQACPRAGRSCVVGLSGPDGHYTIAGVSPGTYDLTAFPPQGSSLLPGHAGPLLIATGAQVTQDFVLVGPHGPPPGTTITDRSVTGNGVPVLYWHDPSALDTIACANGTVGYSITQGAVTLASGPMAETPPGSGHYHASVPPLYPSHGDATVTITDSCGGTTSSIAFNVYIDPSGIVVDTAGHPISGATVTLLRSDTSTGPFAPVPDGSAIMSPSQRSNPIVTVGDGMFHWDTIAGFYQVQATKAGCVVPGGTATVASTSVFEVPPPVNDLSLVLDCHTIASSTTTLTASPSPTVVGQSTLLQATVTATGAGMPAGNVAFTASDNSITTCGAQPLDHGVATCTVAFPHAATSPLTLTAAYAGDPDHSPSTGTTTLSVAAAHPELSTLASPGVRVGGTVHDTARLAGGVHPTGSVTFVLHGPDDSSCAGPAAFRSTKTVAGNATYVSGDFIPTAPGTYHWVATYSGDADNNAFGPTPCADPAEAVVVGPSQPTPCRSTKTGTITRSVVIAPGQHRCFDKATVKGSITVKPGGELTVTRSIVTGGIVSNGARALDLCSNDIGPALTGPALSVINTTGPIRIGDPPTGCSGNNIRGTTSLTYNFAGLLFGSNLVHGDATVNANKGGAITLKYNLIDGTLACSANNPPPVNAGQPNTARSKSGQCGGL